LPYGYGWHAVAYLALPGAARELCCALLFGGSVTRYLGIMLLVGISGTVSTQPADLEIAGIFNRGIGTASS
jgi:hypothetical protein